MKTWKTRLSLILSLVLLGAVFAMPAVAEDDIPTVIWYQIGEESPNMADALAIINEYSAEKIGVKVDIRSIGWGDWESATNNMLNTGEYFDIMFTNTSHYTNHASQGKFLDIKELKDTASPDLAAFVPEALWTGVTIKGGIYGVPTYKDSSQTQWVGWDKALVEKYEIDIDNIKTMEDLDEPLRKIKAGEEAESGGTFYPLPLSKEGFNSMLFMYDNYVYYADETATVINTYERPEVIASYELLHKWWEDGIINPDASTVDETQRERACFVFQGFPGADVQLSADRGYEIVARPYSPTIYSTESILGSVNAISANSSYPEESLKFLELANTDPFIRNILAYGVEDVDWKDNGDGTITRLMDTWKLPGYSVATFFTMKPIAPNPADQWDLVREQNDNAVNHVILGFSLDDTAVADEVIFAKTIIDKYKPELHTGCYTGTTAEYLQKMNDELFAADFQNVLDETQRQVDEFLGK